MKKTLVALAVLAASSASFAQVTITGKLGFSYDKQADSTARVHGMSMADGDVVFGASEDLGGGMKVDASSAVKLRGRDTGVSGRNATVALTTGVGKFTLGAVESCSKIDNVAGAPVSLGYAQDGSKAPLDGCANLDIASFGVPVGPVTLGVAYIDSVGFAGAGATGSSTLDAATGTTSATGKFTANQVTLGMVSGALTLGLDHTVFARSGSLASGGTGVALAQAKLNAADALYDGLARTRLTVAYDLGMAKLGFGHQITNHDKASQTTFSVAVPMGAATVGLAYASRAAQDTSATYAALTKEEARSSTAVGVDYALSKLTTVNVSWANYTEQSGALDNEYRIRLMKAF